MPELIRPSWGGYYKTPVGTPLLCIDWFHLYPCGLFVHDSIEYQLLFVIMFKDEMPDTICWNQEAFDLVTVDADDILTNGLDAPVPLIQSLIEQDTIEGLDGWEIMERRIGVMIPEFMGFTFDEVLANFPNILQPVVTLGEDGNEITTANIRANSLEEPLEPTT